MIFEHYGRLLSTNLPVYLRKNVQVSVASSETVTFAEFSNALSNPVLLTIVNFSPMQGSIIMELTSGLGYAIIDRMLGGKGERRAVIVFYFSLFSCLVVAPMFIVQYTPMAWWQVVYLLLAGGCAGAAQFSITTAYAFAPAKEISVYDYFQVVFTALLGWTCFAEIPDLLSIVGYVIILTAAILKYLKAKKQTQKEK